ncbi:response regulator transcription factor [Pacificimonas sp. WHA3]|uniref:Response regulator transcription factor n=1 Tax=Pacificimonas pallii TaxID=2827236 RepID=A0ABS6SEW8_9SPHN|nr:response regulator transcription factor [Pacificimonas pallii]MBV7256881.1 response regulator transcription factor [Pacificimonas pallii]
MTGRDEVQMDERFRALFVDRSALLLEDEPAVAGYLASVLSRNGFTSVDTVASGEDAVRHAGARTYDVLILDRMTAGLDGLGALAQIRAGDGPSRRAPALFLTALGSERHKIEGLAAGSDDYAVKPLSDVELLARVAALLRRFAWAKEAAPAGQDMTISIGSLILDPGKMTAELCGHNLDLTPREHSILQLLARNVGLPVTRTMLWSECWSNYNFMPENAANTIDVHMSRLRKKLDPACDCLPDELCPIIVSVRSQGLMLRNLADD